MEYAKEVQEFASILRGEHTGWKGDKIANAGAFLYRLRYESPVFADGMAENLSGNIETYSELTGLPSRRLLQAVKVLTGEWVDL